jgi:hypothetical protein
VLLVRVRQGGEVRAHVGVEVTPRLAWVGPGGDEPHQLLAQPFLHPLAPRPIAGELERVPENSPDGARADGLVERFDFALRANAELLEDLERRAREAAPHKRLQSPFPDGG